MRIPQKLFPDAQQPMLVNPNIPLVQPNQDIEVNRIESVALGEQMIMPMQPIMTHRIMGTELKQNSPDGAVYGTLEENSVPAMAKIPNFDIKVALRKTSGNRFEEVKMTRRTSIQNLSNFDPARSHLLDQNE